MFVDVDQNAVSKAAAFAELVCAAYERGEKENSRVLLLLGKPEIYSNRHVQKVGRVGEIAACLAFRLDPDIALNWSNRCDNGADFRLLKWTVDVKSSDHPNAKRLIWPASKEHFMRQAADILIFARVKLFQDNSAEVELAGYETKRRFIDRCHYALNERGLVDGTPYLFMHELRPVIDIRDYLLTQDLQEQSAAGRVPV